MFERLKLSLSMTAAIYFGVLPFYRGAVWCAGSQGLENPVAQWKPAAVGRSLDKRLAGEHLKLGPLSSVPVPRDNPITPGKVFLGKQLFFDPRLSKNSAMSCATCHDPRRGYGDGLPRAIGYMGTELARNSPPLYTVAYQKLWFWDGRARSLEEQVLMPVQSPEEMNQELPGLEARLRGIPEYGRRFEEVFGQAQVSAENVAKAIATFLRTIAPGPSPLDRFLKGDRSALSPPARRGLKLFQGKGKCALCHNGPNLTDDGFHNIGVPSADPFKDDVGRYKVIALPALKGAFKTPSLRMVALTAPYMHNGVFATLDEVIEFYDRGGDVRDNLAPEMAPLKLTTQEKDDLKAFLLALTGGESPVELPKLPPLGPNGETP